jgi:hypothetical protein
LSLLLFFYTVTERLLLIIYITDQPNNDPKIQGDPFKTLYVGRLSYEATEKDLEREFGRFGPIEKVHYFWRWRRCLQISHLAILQLLLFAFLLLPSMRSQ